MCVRRTVSFLGVALLVSGLVGGCSAPRKSTIPVDSPLRPWTPPDPETYTPATDEEAPPAPPADEAKPAPAPTK